MDEDVRIAEIEINDLLGTRSLKFSPGTCTVLTGANGTGKSSVIRALVSLWDGGHRPEEIRKGAKQGKITVRMSNAAQIVKTVTPTKTKVEITDENGLPVKSAREHLDELGTSWSLDPARLLAIDASTKPGRRALSDELAKVLPLSFRGDELIAALNANDAELPDIDEAGEIVKRLFGATLDLDGLEKTKKQLEEARRLIGRDRDQAEKTIQGLNKSLPPTEDEPTDWGDELTRLESERRTLDERERAEIDAIEQRARLQLKEASDDFASRERKLYEEYQDKLRSLESEKQKNLAAIQNDEGGHIDAIRERNAPVREKLAAELATAKEKAAQQERASGAREMIAQMWEQLRAKGCEYDTYSVILSAVGKLKKKKLDDLPIPGIEVTADNVLVDGVEWQNVNTARKAMIALHLCALRSGRLSCLLLDDSEHLDAESWSAVKQACVDSGYQLIAARVSADGPLAIEVDGVCK